MELPFKVIDADGHINEPEDEIVKYMDPPYNDYLHSWVPDANGTIYPTNTLVPKQPGWDPTLGGKLGTNGPSGFPFPDDWIKVMDKANVERTFLYPTTFLPHSLIVDPDYLIALTRAYNSFVYEHWLNINPRFGSVALVPLLDIEESIKEIRRSTNELGFAGVFAPAVGYGLLGKKQLHPFFEEAQSLGSTISVHGGHATSEYLPYTRFIQRHIVGFPVSNIIQMTSLTLEGIFEIFPDLKVAFLEAGCTWVPYMLNRMDEEWELRGRAEAPLCKRKPSEYITSDRVFVHLEPEEDLLPQTISMLGDNSLVYASDWPHWDNDFPNSILKVWERDDLSSSQKRGILRDNALAMYGIN